MGIEQRTHFRIDKSKCIGCGKCVNTCSGMVLSLGKEGYPQMRDFERFGWRGCWRCQHCLAVCPTGAISIFDKEPENSFPLPPPEMGSYIEQLVVSRRSCRRYLDKNVEPQIVDGILNAMQAAPTGGDSSSVEYTVIDDKDRVKEIWQLAYSKMEAAAKKYNSIGKEKSKTATELAYAEVISYNRKNLERELQRTRADSITGNRAGLNGRGKKFIVNTSIFLYN